MKYCIRDILANDIVQENGKQIEFSKTIASEFFDINPQETERNYNFIFFPSENKHQSYNLKEFQNTKLQKSPHRGDYKIYGEDNIEFKNFLRNDLQLKAKSAKLLFLKRENDSNVFFTVFFNGNTLLDLFKSSSKKSIDSIEYISDKADVLPFSRNIIVFGAPGTGKSYKLKNDSMVFSSDCIERVTFHPSYTYSQFVGTYKPLQEDKEDGKIRYEYVPGPFMRIYIQAIQNKEKNYLLLIEEINRANVTAVFGDIFQLLDRDKNGDSQYPIATSEDAKRFLKSKGVDECGVISIPSNMYIWATMNSADQGVLPIDAAFKRRWNFEYVDIDNSEDIISDYPIPLTMGENDESEESSVQWNTFRKKLNNKLSELGVNEDKLIGPFFLDFDSLEKSSKREEFFHLFESKLIMYLFEDVVKMRPGELFNLEGITPRYSSICKKLEQDGLKSIFLFAL